MKELKKLFKKINHLKETVEEYQSIKRSFRRNRSINRNRLEEDDDSYRKRN